jgi:protoheme IX farnesyltransferase
MKAAVRIRAKPAPLAHPHAADFPVEATEAPARPRVADYLELTKPRVAVLVLFTVAVGALLASGPRVNGWVLLHTLLGTALVAGGASALNQWLERRSDAKMRRTENRPLPAGRLSAAEVLTFGGLLGAGGVAYLALALGHWAAAAVAALTFALYVGVYTPLKRVTTLNTLVGAVPGALPPLIGWAAARGGLTWAAAPLFLILFLWQVPHFLAIAWAYRDDYARAGLRMLPVFDRTGRATARRMVGWCVALLAASLTPPLFGPVGRVYLGGAAVLGLGFLAAALYFRRAPSAAAARLVLRASLVYLPGLLALLLLDALVPLLAGKQ